MDLITQGLLGAVVGQVGFSRTLGLRRATLWGAVIGMLPDIDVIFKFFSHNPMAEQLYHRGFTHSLFFAPLVAPVAALLCDYFNKKSGHQTSKLAWFGLWFWALITHPLLDWFTTYGTQLLHPLSYHRFSLHAISVIDFHYSAVLALCLMISPLFTRRLKALAVVGAFGLLLSTTYLFYGIVTRDHAIQHGKNLCDAQDIAYKRVEAFPEIGDVRKRRITVQTKNSIRIMYFNTLSKHQSEWQVFTQSNLEPNAQFKSEINTFKWFSDDWIWAQDDDQNLVLWDARFFTQGQFLWGITVNGAEIKWIKHTSFKKALKYLKENLGT